VYGRWDHGVSTWTGFTKGWSMVHHGPKQSEPSIIDPAAQGIGRLNGEPVFGFEQAAVRITWCSGGRQPHGGAAREGTRPREGGERFHRDTRMLVNDSNRPKKLCRELKPYGHGDEHKS